MISLSTLQLAAFEEQVALAFVKLEAEMSVNFAAFTRKIFISIVQTSPQWSGNLASNWNYSVKTPNEGYNSIKPDIPAKGFKPYQVGSDPATGKAIARMSLVDAPSWRDTVYITNATPSDDAGYLAEHIIEGKVNLRPVNLIPAQGAIFEFTVEKFKDEIL